MTGEISRWGKKQRKKTSEEKSSWGKKQILHPNVVVTILVGLVTIELTAGRGT